MSGESKNEFLELQNDKESVVKTAEHTDVSDPNSEGPKEDTDFIENNQKSGDDASSEERKEEQQPSSSASGGDDSSKQPASSSSGPGGDDTSEQTPSGGDGEDSGEKKEGGSGEKKQNASSRENVDSIPTAGGERLGEKHWGESKIVPDVPKEEGKDNVSSSDGQPDQETKDNTAKNSGGSSGDSGEGDKSFMEKIKEKLPGGH